MSEFDYIEREAARATREEIAASLKAMHQGMREYEKSKAALREDNKRLEALVRAKDETIGELLDFVYHDADNYWVEFDKWLEGA